MEDGLDAALFSEQVLEHTKNGVINPVIMANFPDIPAARTEEIKPTESAAVNGERLDDYEDDPFNDSYSSESDALVIDESAPKRKQGKGKEGKKLKENRTNAKREATPKADLDECPNSDCAMTRETFVYSESDTNERPPTENNSCEPYPGDIPANENNPQYLPHSNPYFHESLFELSQLHQSNNSELFCSDSQNTDVSFPINHTKPTFKPKEYPQYLGLQPAVQFKCPKCGKSGFESLLTLQEHFLQCNTVQTSQQTRECANVSGFKLTRKVFLCSACGTYYENWNLYMHMLEYHRRYICLYCLGMFSVLDDLCQHIQSRHNLQPGIKNSLQEFYNTYNDPCYVICCECNQQFNEGDDFFYHNCISKQKNKSKHIKQVIAPENHVTGDFAVSPKQLSDTAKIKGDNNARQDCEPGSVSQKVTSDVSDSEEETNLERKGAVSVMESTKSVEEQSNVSEHDTSNSSKCSEGNQEPAQLRAEQDITETRRVPKLSLKLPKPGSYQTGEPEDSDDSDKHDMDIDNIESETEPMDAKTEDTPEQRELVNEDDAQEDRLSDSKEKLEAEQNYSIAGMDIPITEIELDQPLDKMEIKTLLRKCLIATVPSCIYCNHTRRIAVNGKQLGLHAVGEHRYSAINKGITEEELTPDSFNARIIECLDQLETVFFNLESGTSEEAVIFSHVFECFQCHYSTKVHKELYLHNRKFHTKNWLLCIMCKSNFYSYSDLICHLCPGVYVLDVDLQFRCCMCVSDDLSSSFRLMVHLRKRHNLCDVCLETCHSQYKLSNHVWKHKLHHFCYRCGIAYRNKPDITRHLFWKHGTESVLCKKCLQKKWPHVYHFCVPPASFSCEECNLVFTRAVSLKVHKRLHTDEKKHCCTWEGCNEAFISKKLMLKHLKVHTDPPEEVKVEDVHVEEQNDINGKDGEKEVVCQEEEPPKPVKPKVDVYDLPELNLSESDSSDSENEPDKPKTTDKSISQLPSESDLNVLQDNILIPTEETLPPSELKNEEDTLNDSLDQQPLTDDTSSAVMQDIWVNFKNYQASKEKLLIGDISETKIDQPYIPDIPIPIVEEGVNSQVALLDHDYCKPEEEETPAQDSESIDHDYCFQKNEENADETTKIGVKPVPSLSTASEMATAESRDVKATEQPPPAAKKEADSSDSSSSDSDSSCECGSSCSCSDSSSDSSSSTSVNTSSDSSTEEGRKRQQEKRLKRKETNKENKASTNMEQETDAKIDVVSTDHLPVLIEMPVRESDLETTESETDEEFYDREPQKFARKILQEKRAQLLAEMGPHMVPNGSFIESTSRPPTPPAGSLVEEQHKKKKKTKKRKKKRDKRSGEHRASFSIPLMDEEEPIVPVPPPTIPYYQQFHQTGNMSPTVVPPFTLSLNRNSPAQITPSSPLTVPTMNAPSLSRHDSSSSNANVRASKRRRVPNKFYGYSSDEEAKKNRNLKRMKQDANRSIMAPPSPRLVPPITIKTGPFAASPKPQQVLEPITLKLPKHHGRLSETRSHKRPMIPPLRLSTPKPPLPLEQSGSDSNDSDVDISPPSIQPVVCEPAKPAQPQLYCYCRCPYDEVSEMIGCDSDECQIEWFHFECVGIMVPPKGQWFCPDCRKKKQQQQQQRNLT